VHRRRGSWLRQSAPALSRGTSADDRRCARRSQEPRKSDAPQLRDEYRTYKILAGSRASRLYPPVPYVHARS